MHTKPHNSNLVPMVVEQEGRGERSYDIFSRLLKDRIIYVGTGIDSHSVELAIAEILFLIADDTSRPIQMYISSPGGSILDGDGLLDAMDYAKSKGVVVETICVGYAASFGALLLANGTKGHRFVLPRSRVMIHQPRGGMQGTVTDAEIEMALMKDMKDTINEFMARVTGQSLETIQQKMERDTWLKAQEAVDFGIADEIIDVTPKA